MAFEATMKTEPVRLFKISCWITMAYLVPLCSAVTFGTWNFHNLLMNMFGIEGIGIYPSLIPYYVRAAYVLALFWMVMVYFSGRDPIRYAQLAKFTIIVSNCMMIIFCFCHFNYLVTDMYAGKPCQVGVMDTTFSGATGVSGIWMWVRLRKEGKWKAGLE